MRAAPPPKRPRGKLGAAALRELARAHTEVAVQVLAEVATTGSSEASRISAAMALLDRGYGKSGSGLASADEASLPILYHRIELVDGNDDNSDAGDRASDNQD